MKIGVIGAIGDCLGSISGEFKTGLYFKTGNELTNLVKNEATRLREEENCDLIVYSVHDGGEGYSSGVNNVENSDMGWYDTSLSDGYVDLVFEAHTHQQYILKDEYGVYHLQGGGENRAVSCAQVEFNTATGKYTVTPRLISNNVYAKSSIADAPVVKSLYRRYFADSDPYENVLGNNVSEWDSTDICDKLAELYLKKGVDTWGDQYDIVLGGGYLNTRSPYDLARGSVTYADVFSLLPFDNAIVLGGISGRYLKSNFLTPKRNYYSYTNGNIVAADIDDNETYYIIVDSYTSTYAPNHITEVARLGGETYARDLLAEYIAAGKRA